MPDNENRRNLVLILAFLKVRAFTFDGEYMIISLVQKKRSSFMIMIADAEKGVFDLTVR
ncbi:MAG TPA: hypothetical protein RWO09_10750 [Ruminococcus sp.]